MGSGRGGRVQRRAHPRRTHVAHEGRRLRRGGRRQPRRRVPRRWRARHGPLTTSRRTDPMADDTFETFKKCAVEVLQVDPAKVTLDAKFGDDLDADSLDLVELVMALEEAFDIEVPEEELEGITTIGEAYELVTSKLS